MPPRKLPADAKLIEWYLSEMSPAEIAEMLGNVSHITVSSALSRLAAQGLVKIRSIAEADQLARRKGRKVATKFWLGKKQPKDMVERRTAKQRGENHYLWKGGLSLRPYRDLVEKDLCAHCGSIEQLLIHHINGNHYDNEIDNLQVLCSPCHSSMHKTEFWELVRAGERPIPPAPKGSKNGQSKLTEADIKKVFELRTNGLTQREIGEILGVSQTQIGRILRGERWNCLKEK